MTKAALRKVTSLSEMEVFGRGGPVARPKAAPLAQANGRLHCSPAARGACSGIRSSRASGEAISKVGFQDTDWVVATVPATMLVSYLNVGAIPNPDFGDNQLQISDSFFYADFWYRNEFVGACRRRKGEHVWLNFDGINWKADVYLNGEKVGRIDGGFMRGKFDVTKQIRPGAKNAHRGSGHQERHAGQHQGEDRSEHRAERRRARRRQSDLSRLHRLGLDSRRFAAVTTASGPTCI